MGEYTSSVTGVKIITTFDHPPIPSRSCDWSAVDDNYDGTEGCNCPIGRGATEKEAIADLEEQLAERESEKTAISRRFHPRETRPINPETLKFIGKLTERDYHEEIASGEATLYPRPTRSTFAMGNGAFGTREDI